ncbi:MAG: dihydrofolate reductase family protein, partial [Armatimonadetes bacterium]|nr:dihydrofolate reductase family protein [Armatimonadota bacterium]
RWVSCERSRREAHRLRSTHDAVLVGIGTVLADDPELTVRGIRGGVNPLRIVVDGNASIPLDAKVLGSDAPTIIVTKRDAPEERLDALWNAGVRVLGVRDIEGRIDLSYLMAELAKMGVNSVLLEGGGELAASMIEHGLVDRGIVFIAPKIVGGRDAKTPVEGIGIELMSGALNVSKPKIRRFGDDFALEFEFPSA